jgi:hypothetical protein
VLLILPGMVLLADAAGSSDNCVYYQDVAAGQSLDVFSPNYPNSYPKGVDCTWEAVAPSTSHFILVCDDFSIPNVSDILFALSPSVQIHTFMLLNILYNNFNSVRFQVLTAASTKFRIVLWDVLLCKIIVDRRFRGTCSLHHHPRRQF